MVLKVLMGKVCKNSCVKKDIVNPFLVKAVAGNLHNNGSLAGFKRLIEQGVYVDSIRRGSPGRDMARAKPVLYRAYEARRDTRPFKYAFY